MLILQILESDISLAVLVPFTGGWHFGTTVWALTVLVPLAAVAVPTSKECVFILTPASSDAYNCFCLYLSVCVNLLASPYGRADSRPGVWGALLPQLACNFPLGQ